MVDEDKLRGKKTHQAKMDTKIANRNRDFFDAKDQRQFLRCRRILKAISWMQKDPKGNFFDAEGSKG